MRKAVRVILYTLGGFLALVVVAVLAVFAVLRTEAGRDWLAATISDAASTPGQMELRIGAIDGPLPGSIGVRDLQIADADGVWLTLERARLNWDPLALFAGRVAVDLIDVDGAHVRRLPAGGPPPAEEQPTDFTLPSVPVDIVVRRLEVDGVRLDEPVAGMPVTLRAEGQLAAAEAGEIRTDLIVERTDGSAGKLVLNATMEPGDRTIDLEAVLTEPEGGLIARTLAVPGLPPVTVRLTGGGPIEQVAGTLTAAMGDDLGADLEYRVAYSPENIGFALTGKARVAPLVPEPHRAAVSGGFGIDLAAALAGQTVTLQRLSAASDAASLTAEGTAVLDAGTLDMQVGVGLKQPELIALYAPEVSAEEVALQAHVTGSFDRPRLHLEAEAGRVTLPAATVEGLTATIEAEPQKPLNDGLAVSFRAVALATRLVPAQAPEAAGPMFLNVAGTADMEASRVTIERLALSHALAKAEGSAVATLEPLGLEAKLALDAPSLAPLSVLAGMPVAGAAQVTVDATVAAAGQSVDATVDGTVRNLQLPTVPAAAALAGETATLQAKVQTAADSNHRVDATLATAAAEVKVEGTIASAFDTLDIGYRVAVPQLAALTPITGTDLAGTAELTGRATGPVASPTVIATLDGKNVGVAGQGLGAVRAEVRAEDVAGAAKGSLSFRAAPPQGAVTLATDFAKSDTAVRLDKLRIGAPGGSLSGQVTAPLDGAPAQGTIAGRFQDIAPLLALGGMDGSGALNLSIELSGENGAQAADADVELSRFRLQGGGEPLQIASVDLEAKAVLAETPRGNMTLTLSGLNAGGSRVDRLTLRARGAQSGADFELATNGEATVPFRIEAAGNAGYAEGAATVRLDRLTGTLRNERLRLRRPARIVAGPGGIEVDDLNLALASGSLTADATMRADRFEGTLQVNALPLALARLASPDTDVQGRVSGRVSLSGSAAAPRGTAAFDFTDVRYGGANELPPIDARIEADWRDGTLDTTARISGFDGPPIAITAAVPLRMDAQAMVPFVPQDGPLQASLRWNGQIAPLFLLLPLDGHQLRGRADIDLGVTGTVGAPRAAGTVSLRDGEYENLMTGTLLDNLSLRAQARGDRITISELSATDGAGGRISGSGYAMTDGSNIDVRLQANDAVVVRRDDVTAAIDADLTFRRTPDSARAAGTITTDTVEIRLVDNLPPSVVDLEVTERGGGRKPPEPDLEPQTPSVDAPDVQLDIAVSMPRRVFVRGRGLDSEWSGSVKIGGTASQPVIRGEINSVRGNLDFLTRDFTLQPSSIGITQDTRNQIVANLDVSAAAEIEDLQAIVKVGGTAASPEIQFTSNPPRPQDEVLALILFGKTTAQLTAFEAVQLAGAVAQLTSGGGGGIMDFARSALGVDVLRVGGTGEGGPTIQAGRYIAKDVFVGVEQGTTAGSSAVSVEAEIFPNVSVESKVTPDGNSNVGLKMEWDY